MPSLLLSQYPTTTRRLSQDLGVPDDCIRESRGREPERLHAHTPYLLGACHDSSEHAICSMLEPHGRVLTEMCRELGESATLGLADLSSELRRYGLAGVGAGADLTRKRRAAPSFLAPTGGRARRSPALGALYSGRIGRFVEAVQEHQTNMLAYHQATRKGASADAAAVAEARSKLVRSGSDLNQRFALELDATTRRLRPRQRTLMSDRHQMPELVRKPNSVAQLNVGSHIEASRLVQLSRNTRIVGRTVVIVDLGLRADEVFEAYEAGEDWQRKAVVESAGFILSAVEGTLLTRAALISLQVILAPTPAGWALILGTGLAATAFVASGSSLADHFAKYVAELSFDAFHSHRTPSP